MGGSRKTHRSIPILLALALVVPVGALAPGAASAASGHYSDDDGGVHEPGIEAITDAGVATGCNPPANTLFCPTVAIDRATMAVWLIRALDEDGNLPSYRGYFPDMPPGDFYTPYAERLYELGVTLGKADGRYDPDGSVVRSQMSAYLVRAFGDEPTGSAAGLFTDISRTAWFAAYAEALYDMGITIGCSTNPLRYCPTPEVPRGQMATFVGRAMGLISGVTDGGDETTTTDVWDPPDCPGGGFCLTPSLSEGFGKRTITYCVSDFSTRTIDESKMAADAFAVWGSITVGSENLFTFSSTTCDREDIEIKWVNTLDKGVLGNASPDSYFTPTHVVINIRDDGTMTARAELSTLIHEIGHGLGLNHSLDPACMMYPDSGGTAQRNGTLCQEELNTLGALYSGYIGSDDDAFHALRVSAEGDAGPTERLASLTNSGTMPLPCAVDGYWTEDVDMGWLCQWADTGQAWAWDVTRIDAGYERPGLGIGLTAVAIDTAAYDVTWLDRKTVVGNDAKTFAYSATDTGLIIPFVVSYDPAGAANYGWTLHLIKTPLGGGQNWAWELSTFGGNSDSLVAVRFVRIERRDNWGWSYGFTVVRGSGTGSSTPGTYKVSANNWATTTHFSVTTGYVPAGENAWAWSTYTSPVSYGCPGTAKRCIEVTLDGFGGNTSSWAEVMTVVLGR